MIQIIENPVKDKKIDGTYLKRMDKNCHYILKHVLNDYPHDLSGIAAVEIETLNRCNNDCSFCPVNRNVDTRKFYRMSEEMYYSIIEQLADINYVGEISIFSNNEPLLDKRIFDFVRYAKERLPLAHHSLYTNGILLNNEKFEKLVDNLDTLYIDNYDDELKIMPNIQNIIENYVDKKLECDVYILIRKKTQILDTRGGSAPNRNMQVKYTSTCIAPYTQLIIRPDGKISRCCQDPLGRTTMGDLNKNTISEIWSNELYDELRQNLQMGKRAVLPQCQYCDVFGNVTYTRSDWQSKLVKAVVEILWEKKLTEHKKIYLYGSNYYKILLVLSVHGIEVDGIITDVMDDRINDTCSFIVFIEMNCNVLDIIDPDIIKIGTDYIVVDMLLEVMIGKCNQKYSKKDYLIQELNKLNVYNDIGFYIFGTGKIAEKVVELLKLDGDHIIAYVDNNKNKWGKQFNGHPIIAPDLIKCKTNPIIIASSYYTEIENQLIEQGICEKKQIINAYKIVKIYEEL